MIAVQNHVTHEWNIRGRIIKYIHPRSYEIKLDNGRRIRRKRLFLRQLYAISVSCENWDNSLSKVNASEESNNEEPISYDDERTSDSDSDDMTIPYDESSDIQSDSSDVTIPYEESEDSDKCNVSYAYITQIGRRVKRKVPTDYEQL